jgi:hypothetical protein
MLRSAGGGVCSAVNNAMLSMQCLTVAQSAVSVRAYHHHIHPLPLHSAAPEDLNEARRWSGLILERCCCCLGVMKSMPSAVNSRSTGLGEFKAAKQRLNDNARLETEAAVGGRWLDEERAQIPAVLHRSRMSQRDVTSSRKIRRDFTYILCTKNSSAFSFADAPPMAN